MFSRNTLTENMRAESDKQATRNELGSLGWRQSKICNLAQKWLCGQESRTCFQRRSASYVVGALAHLRLDTQRYRTAHRMRNVLSNVCRSAVIRAVDSGASSHHMTGDCTSRCATVPSSANASLQTDAGGTPAFQTWSTATS